MKERKANRSHARIVFECAMSMRKAERENDFDKELNIMKRYGRKTVNEAIELLNDWRAEEMGMTREEFNEWLAKED